MKPPRGLRRASGVLFLGALACWGAYAAIGGEVGVDGVLREPFALIPLGWFGCATAVASGVGPAIAGLGKFQDPPGQL